ncbi:MAG: hypothetical protein HKN90_00565 [Flavobacteriaceae bacterium]|nr:hypothetical protein [Flavobacteriaceae bacterium]
MKKILVFTVLVFFLSSSFSVKNSDEFKFKIEWAQLNKSLWFQPYRFDNKELKSLSVKIAIERMGNDKVVNLNHISLIDETKNLRIRPIAAYYLKSRDRKKYQKLKAVNTNYNAFEDYNINGFTNFQAKTFKPNILGKKRKNTIASVKSLKNIIVRSKLIYYLDFPVNEDFSYGKVYYKDKPIGFAAVKK